MSASGIEMMMIKIMPVITYCRINTVHRNVFAAYWYIAKTTWATVEFFSDCQV
jgi:hypothetical protein